MYDDCGIERYSAFGALDAVSTKFPKDIRECYGDGAYELFLGVLGTSRSQTTSNVLNMLGSNIPVISPFATLPELANFPNFLRTTPADNDQVQVVIQLLKDLNWTYIAALYTNDNYGSSGMEKILQLARENGICVDVVQAINSTENFANIATLENFLNILIHQKKQTKNKTLGIVYFGQKNVIERLLIRLNQLLTIEYRGFHWIMSDFVGTSVEVFNDADDVSDGTITVSTSSVMIQEAQQFFEDKWNAALTTTNLSSPLDKLIAEYRTENPTAGIDWRNDFIMPIVDAVYVIATALKQALFKKCRNYTIICDGFEDYLDNEFLNIMKNTTVDYGLLNYTAGPKELVDLGRQVRFDPHGNILPDRSSPLYDINMYNVTRKSFVKVGTYKNTTLSLNSSLLASHQQLSSCASNCSNCTVLPPIPYKYVDGDVLLMGMFSIHDPKDEEHAFACGKFRNYTLDVIGQESFFHAIYRLRNLTKIQFGGISFDDCYSSTVGSLTVTQFLSGTTKLPFGSTGQTIDPTKVLGVIGPYPSGVTVPLTLLFSRLKLPSVSYASSSPDLDDVINYPYFLRTVPSDVTQVEAMVKIIEHMGWKRVGMLYVNNNYGSKGKALFMDKAASSGICVTTPIEMSETGNQNELYQISLDIKSKGEEVIVYFGTEARIVDLLTEMKRRVEQNSFRYDFVFLASEDWGDSNNIGSKLGSVAKGAITFKFEIKSADVGFEDYLRNRKPVLEPTNRWYREYWREYFNCDPEGDFDKRIGKTCSKDLQFSQQDLSNFVDDQRVIHTMNAVYALGLGLNEVKDLCPPDNLHGCQYLKEQPEDVVKHILNIELQSGSESFPIFDEKGNGNLGFTILNLQVAGQDTYDYLEVGTYKAGRLDLSKNLLKFYNHNGSGREITAPCGSSCECFVTTTFTTTEATTQGPTVTSTAEYQTSTIVIIAVVSSSCLLLLLLLLIVVVCFCKLRREYDGPNASKPLKRYYNTPSEPSGGGISQVSKPPSDIQFINPQGMSSDIKYMGPVSTYDGEQKGGIANGPKGQVNRAFSDPYLHPAIGSNSSEQMYRQQTPMSEGYDQGRNDYRRNESPVRCRNREPVTNSSPMSESNTSNYRPDLPPREEGIPNLKQYQLPNGYPRMGTSHVINGSPPVGNSPTDSDHALLNLLAGNNNVTPTDDSPVFSMSDQGSPFGEMHERDRKAQFASLKKKQKRLYNQTAMEATQSVEKISRV
ncbi:Metabotropic glutamate receptor 5 [Mizuhopecten yessoensis]|uniref:Metabotropic glutamate receptor 5 n=2 Tax=Mizuhopecten yessoensis TaxID=6573 RepID=A0A210R6L8_MIZYE|nr:Metabotropic glutamate receptor 5 [Mizuhopecten yessoensis]